MALETPNIAAGLEWWIANGKRTGDMLQCFGDMPFFDGVRCTTDVTLEELATMARAAIDIEGRGASARASRDASVFVCLLEFLSGDIDEYRHAHASNARGR